MSSPKTRLVLHQLGKDLRLARLRRSMALSDLALRAGTSTSTITRLERGEAGVGIGTLVDVLVVLGLAGRLADLIDVRHDELGLALSDERLPRRGRSSTASQYRKPGVADVLEGVSDPDGVAF
jgi:transcriptional regulator with XRE-family HTH domain